MDAGIGAVALDRLMPHRPPMRWIDAYEWVAPGRLRAEALLGADHLFAGDDGKAQPEAIIEWIAQAGAVMCAYEARRNGGRAGIGYLAGVREFAWDELPAVGARLEIEIATELKLAEALVIRGKIGSAGKRLAEALITVWQPAGTEAPDRIFAKPPSRRMPNSRPLVHTLLMEGLKGDIQTTENSVAASFCFNEDAAIFDGHFPGHPILPGVDILAMASLLCSRQVGRPVRLAGVSSIKFSKPVPPGETVAMELQIAPDQTAAGSPAWRIKGGLGGVGSRKAALSLMFSSHGIVP